MSFYSHRAEEADCRKVSFDHPIGISTRHAFEETCCRILKTKLSIIMRWVNRTSKFSAIICCATACIPDTRGARYCALCCRASGFINAAIGSIWQQAVIPKTLDLTVASAVLRTCTHCLLGAGSRAGRDAQHPFRYLGKEGICPRLGMLSCGAGRAPGCSSQIGRSESATGNAI